MTVIPSEARDLLLQNRDLTKTGRAEMPAPLPNNGFPNERLPTVGYSLLRTVQSQPVRHAGSVRRIGFVEVLDLQFLDASRLQMPPLRAEKRRPREPGVPSR
jgi:hypothetical protein